MTFWIGLYAVAHLMVLAYIGYEIELFRNELTSISKELHRSNKNETDRNWDRQQK